MSSAFLISVSPPLKYFSQFLFIHAFFSRVTPTKYHWQRNCWSIQCAWHVSFTSNLLGSCLLIPLLAGNSRRLLAKRKDVLFGGECMTEPTLTQFQQRDGYRSVDSLTRASGDKNTICHSARPLCLYILRPTASCNMQLPMEMAIHVIF